MKKIALIILIALSALSAKGQSFYHDSVTDQYVAEIYLTDSSSEIYNQHLKMHIETKDKGDSVQGVVFTITLYSVKKSAPSIVFTTAVGISGAFYNAWDANDDDATYTMAQSNLSAQKIYITFK